MRNLISDPKPQELLFGARLLRVGDREGDGSAEPELLRARDRQDQR